MVQIEDHLKNFHARQQATLTKTSEGFLYLFLGERGLPVLHYLKIEMKFYFFTRNF